MKITFDRWPWQKRHKFWANELVPEKNRARYGWRPFLGLGRFGGGWGIKLGVDIAQTEMVFNLGVGMVVVRWGKSE